MVVSLIEPPRTWIEAHADLDAAHLEAAATAGGAHHDLVRRARHRPELPDDHRALERALHLAAVPALLRLL